MLGQFGVEAFCGEKREREEGEGWRRKKEDRVCFWNEKRPNDEAYVFNLR